MAYGKRALFEDQRSIAFGSIGASYSLVGSVFFHQIRNLIVTNGTDALLQFSIDGRADHFVLQPTTTFILDITSNTISGYAFFIAKSDGVYVKQIDAPSSGSVYVSTLYGIGD